LTAFSSFQEIDEEKPTFSMKYLTNKPVRDLKDEQFLKLTQVYTR